MSSKSPSVLLVVYVSAIFFSRAAVGQSVYGEIVGTFTSVTGRPIASAKVTLISQEKASKSQTMTNQSGNYSVRDLVPDTYDMTVEADGFKTFKEGGIPVFADQSSRVSAQLPEGSAADVVAGIPGAVSILKTERTDVSTTFGIREIGNLPIRDLNLTRFGLWVPGSLPTSLALSINQNPQSGSFINVNGQFFSGTAFQLDGTDNRDPLEGLIVINPNLESVSEMKVTTQNYSAEFGEATAGVVIIQTRSGTNSWHGNAFEFRRTGWGQATNPFSTVPPAPIKRNEFGGSLGGPLIGNKLFVFGDYQGTRQAGGTNQLLSVPTELVHQTCTGVGIGFCDLHEYLHLDPTDPNSGQVFDQNHKPYPNNRIPNSSINLGAVNLLNLLPLPNVGNRGDNVNNFVASGARVFDADQFNTRVDYNASGKLKLLARYTFADFRDDSSPAFGLVAGGVGTNVSGTAGVGRTRNQGLSFNFVYSLTPNLLTDFRFGFFRYHLNLDSPDFGTTPALNFALTPGLNNDLFSSGMPDLEFPGMLPGQQFNDALGSDYLRFGYSQQVNGCNCPLREHEQQFQWVSNWTKIAGDHAFRWGTDIRYLQNFRLGSGRRRAGHLVFDADTTNSNGFGAGKGGLSLATFLLGAVSSFDRFYANPANPAGLNAGERQNRWFFYGQDTWRVTPRLTVNYGLRWEMYFPQTVTGNAAGGFLKPNFASPANSIFEVPGVPGVDRSGNIRNSLTNFGPRLGIAYLMSPSTAIRAGYGRSFDVGFGGSIFGISATQNPPVMIFQSVLDSKHPDRAVFTLGQSPPAFTFPSITVPFSIKDLTAAIFAGSVDNQANQSNVYAVPARMRLPTVDAWNVTVQHQLSPTMYFEVGYVGNKGTHVLPDGLLSFYDLNQPRINGFIGLCQPTVPGVNYCVTPKLSRQRFGPWGGVVRYFGNDASNNYNSLQAKVDKSFRHGYEFLAHYTWAKGLNYEGSYFNVDPSVAKMGYGPSNFDRTHSFVLTNLWSIPVGRGKALLPNIGPAADRILGAWAINAATVWYSGLPFSPTYSRCGKDRDPGDPCRPNIVGDVHIEGSRNEWFTSTGNIPFDAAHHTQSSFDPVTGVAVPGPPVGPWQEPAPGTFGDAGRNSLRGPGFFQTDIAVAKDIAVTERVSLRFRADIFNLFNKVNLANPGDVTGACVDCKGGAAIRGLLSGALQRQLQFSLKLQF
jgi:outer membrane receptor protein involved in Fe transport